LAARFEGEPDIRFHLVVNDEKSAIRCYFQGRALPPNLTVYPRTSEPSVHYAAASLVLNLSRPDQWVETFGLTLLEAMAFGVPVIAPPVGGPLELVDDGVEGFLIDSRNGEELAASVARLADDESLCMRMSEAARRKSERFSPDAFRQSLRDALNLSATETTHQ
jgi:glycosyltransferase involved in cell wall biosynthesis